MCNINSGADRTREVNDLADAAEDQYPIISTCCENDRICMKSTSRPSVLWHRTQPLIQREPDLKGRTDCNHRRHQAVAATSSQRHPPRTPSTNNPSVREESLVNVQEVRQYTEVDNHIGMIVVVRHTSAPASPYSFRARFSFSFCFCF